MTAVADVSGALAVARADPGDVRELAVLHRACLPGSILSELGDDGVARYYAFALASAHEHVFVVKRPAPTGDAGRSSERRRSRPEEDGLPQKAGRLIAGCVLSTSVATLLRRFALGAPGAMARELAGELVASGRLRRRMLARFGEAARGLVDRSPAEPALPEVTQIFTDPAERGRGLGASLLRAAEAAVRAAGYRAYCIHTMRDDNDAGIRFYRREGFFETGTTRSFGDHYLAMTKELT
jgi:ribosomal protein S18 acetylase RimI-like enzyme